MTEAELKEKHITMMRTPADWPVWPALPLKRTDGGWECGLMLEIREGVRPVVYLTNMFAGVSHDTPTEEFESFEAIYDAGWRVD